MSIDKAGTAHELTPARWSHFEDGDGDENQGLRLAPRPRRGTPVPAADDVPAAHPDPAAGPDSAAEEVAAVPAGKSPADRIRGSNVHIPLAVLEPLTIKCATQGLSHGEVIITAIESTYKLLPELINPATTAGGSLFAARRSSSMRPPTGPVTPLNYRLRQGDFDTLDALVTELGASSRTHLITAALTRYFATEGPDDS